MSCDAALLLLIIEEEENNGRVPFLTFGDFLDVPWWVWVGSLVLGLSPLIFMLF